MPKLDCNDHRSAPEFVHQVRDGGETIGLIVVDTLVRGRSSGGLRLAPVLDEATLRALARGMTLKFGIARLPQGGAKAMVLGDPAAPRDDRLAQLARFGRVAGPLLRSSVYQPGPDIGTDREAMGHLLAAAGCALPRLPNDAEPPGHYTAYTVAVALQRCADHVKRSLVGSRVAIEGFGKVGHTLGRLLVERGARVVAISTLCGGLHDPDGLDVERLAALADLHGDDLIRQYAEGERIERSALAELPVDFFCPCADKESVHAGNVARLKARVVCGGANLAVTEEAESALQRRGVICFPDFVSSLGDALGNTMAFAGLHPDEIRAHLAQRYGDLVDTLLERAATEGFSLRSTAERLALARSAETRQRAERPGPLGMAMQLGLGLYRQGLLPAGLMRLPARRFFERSLR